MNGLGNRGGMILGSLFVIICALSLEASAQTTDDALLEFFEPFQVTQSYSCGRNCGEVRSCREAVYQWCVCGYRRADGDNDGVPCEKVCGQSSSRNISNVRQIMSELGC
jgi:hypothetical protein